MIMVCTGNKDFGCQKGEKDDDDDDDDVFF